MFCANSSASSAASLSAFSKLAAAAFATNSAGANNASIAVESVAVIRSTLLFLICGLETPSASVSTVKLAN